MMKKLLVLATAIMMALGCTSALASEVGFDEFPIGEEVDVGIVHLAAVYFQPVDMEPSAEAGLSVEESNIHLEADISANENDLGYGVGDWIPYLTVDYKIVGSDDSVAAEGTFMPMAATDGPHYGANIALPNADTYTVIFTIHSPEENGYLLHVDAETGVSGRFWAEPLVASLATATLNTMLDVRDKVNQELKAYGANIVVKPKDSSLLAEIYDVEDEDTLLRAAYLREDELGNLKTIFWAYNIVDFSPFLTTQAALDDGTSARVVGTWFNHQAVLGTLCGDRKMREGISLSMIPVAVLTALTPGMLIPLCGMATMRCNMVMKPAVVLLAALTAILSAVDAVLQHNAAKREKKP